jgi:hypothetical protein
MIIISPLIFPLTFILRGTGEGEWFFCKVVFDFREAHFALYKFACNDEKIPNMGTGTVCIKILEFCFEWFLRRTKLNELYLS